MHGEVFIVVYLSYSVVGGFKHKHFVYTTDPYNTDPYNNNLTTRSISSGALFLLYGHPQVCPAVKELQTEIFLRDHCCSFSGEDKLSRLIQ